MTCLYFPSLNFLCDGAPLRQTGHCLRFKKEKQNETKRLTRSLTTGSGLDSQLLGVPLAPVPNQQTEYKRKFVISSSKIHRNFQSSPVA
jgi:hypothetical protein